MSNVVIVNAMRYGHTLPFIRDACSFEGMCLFLLQKICSEQKKECMKYAKHHEEINF